MAGKDAFDSPVGNQPDQGHQEINTSRDPGIPKRKRDRDEIKRWREFAFPIAADRFSQQRFGALLNDNASLQNIVGNRGEKEDGPVDRGWRGSEMSFSDPR